MAAGTGVADEVMDGVDVKESHASSADPAAEISAEVATTSAPVLKTWSSIIELHSGYVSWELRFTGRRTCSSDGCSNMNRSQPGRRRKKSLWKRGQRNWRWLQNR